MVKNKHSSFELIENEIVVMDDSYISKEYIRNYYVVGVYNKLRKENEIYICFKKIASGRGYYYCGYYDVFTNLEIVDVSNEDVKEELIFKIIKITSLKDYIISFNLGQNKYSYDDMKNIYDVIKENYVYENDNSLRKIRKYDNRI